MARISWHSLRSYNIIWPNDQTKSKVGNHKSELGNVRTTLDAKFWFRFGCQVDWDNLIAAKKGEDSTATYIHTYFQKYENKKKKKRKPTAQAQGVKT